MNRTVVIVASVVLLHLGALWALHSGLLRRVVETVVPVEVLSDLITPPAPRADVPPAPAPATPAARTAPRPAAKAAPQLSKRMGEQGKVVVRVLIGADGLPQKADIRTSSGFERLDQAALATVMKWRYVPGKRAGVPEAMWFNVPINFVLE
jgi:protein TonB